MSRLQRVKKVVKWLIFNDVAQNESELAKLLGYAQSSFSQIMNEKVPLSEKFIDKLVSLDVDINKDWVMNGNGEMFFSDKNRKQYGERLEEIQTLNEEDQKSLYKIIDLFIKDSKK